MNTLLLSVVTVVRNGEKAIENTINSVARQTFQSYELIVIDGASTDATLEIIRKIDIPQIRIVSEPDTGPYDAMNKAVAIARGEWIIFLNCGDSFHANHTLEKIASQLDRHECEFVYGGVVKIFPFGTRVQSPGYIKDLWKGTIFWHQALFTRKDIALNYKFNTKYKICADYDMTWRAHRSHLRFKRVDQIIADVTSGGISDVHQFRGITERYLIAKKDLPIRSLACLLYQKINIFFRENLKKSLPNRIVQHVILSKKSAV